MLRSPTDVNVGGTTVTLGGIVPTNDGTPNILNITSTNPLGSTVNNVTKPLSDTVNQVVGENVPATVNQIAGGSTGVAGLVGASIGNGSACRGPVLHPILKSALVVCLVLDHCPSILHQLVHLVHKSLSACAERGMLAPADTTKPCNGAAGVNCPINLDAAGLDATVGGIVPADSSTPNLLSLGGNNSTGPDGALGGVGQTLSNTVNSLGHGGSASGSSNSSGGGLLQNTANTRNNLRSVGSAGSSGGVSGGSGSKNGTGAQHASCTGFTTCISQRPHPEEPSKPSAHAESEPIMAGCTLRWQRLL